ncbi:MAG: hypothetical protein KAX77_05540 [Xanthomonadales bacterium]|nr:hypothetical protein [Xanthomonadales bacterium]
MLFTQTLSAIAGGLFVRQVEDELKALVEAIQESGKSGTLTLKLKLRPHGRGNREIHVDADVRSIAPPTPTDSTIFFAQRGQLLRDDPDQRDMFKGPKAVDNLQADGRSPAEQPTADAG